MNVSARRLLATKRSQEVLQWPFLYLNFSQLRLFTCTCRLAFACLLPTASCRLAVLRVLCVLFALRPLRFRLFPASLPTASCRLAFACLLPTASCRLAANLRVFTPSRFRLFHALPTASFRLLFVCLLLTASSHLAAQSAHDLYLSALAKDSAKDFSGALADLEKALEMQENDSLHVLHARIETETSHYKEAYDEVNEVLRHNRKYTDAYMLRGVLRARQGNYEGAVRDFSKCIKLDAKNAKAYYNRGLAHAYLEEIRQAINDFTKATELDPGYAIAWFQRGYWKEISGDPEGALADLLKAKELNPNDKNLYVSLAVAYYKLKKNKEACENLNEAKTRGSTEAEELIMMFCNEQ